MLQRADGGSRQPSRGNHSHPDQGLHSCSQRRLYHPCRCTNQQRYCSKACLACISCCSYHCSHLPQFPPSPPPATSARRHAKCCHSLLLRAIGRKFAHEASVHTCALCNLMNLVSGLDPPWSIFQQQRQHPCQDCMLWPSAPSVRASL